MVRQIGLVTAILCVTLLVAGGESSRPKFHARREAASDLEVSGMLKGVPLGQSRFISRAFLLSLPQVSVKIDHNGDFPAITAAGVSVGGIYLDVLVNGLGGSADALATEAICIDGYVSPFPPGYTKTHRPIFVMTIDGLSPHEWSATNHGYDEGPYFIAYEHFEPSFRVLSHDDWAEEPEQVTKLIFTTEDRLYAGTKPKVYVESLSPVMQGYQIAQQNCFRCHSVGGFGGTKAGVSWAKIGAIAKKRPEYFATWVYDPRAVKPKTQMPANKNYDGDTLTALQRYFATFAVEGQ